MMVHAFVGRRADGNHSDVSPEMLLEIYNVDAHEVRGLDGVTSTESDMLKGFSLTVIEGLGTEAI